MRIVYLPLYMKYNIILILVLTFFVTSCKSGFETIQKSKDFNYKLQKADEYYDKKHR
jgi:uncharacterized membrane protein YciS (DUF1049 family)